MKFDFWFYFGYFMLVKEDARDRPKTHDRRQRTED